MSRALLAVTLLLGCATSAPDAGAHVPLALQDKSWVAVEIDGKAPATSASRLEFHSDGSAGGSGGCNSFHGAVTFEGNHISFGPLASTMKMCPDPVMQQEHSFLAALGAAKRIEQTGDVLLLYDDGPAPRLRLQD